MVTTKLNNDDSLNTIGNVEPGEQKTMQPFGEVNEELGDSVNIAVEAPNE